MGQHSAMVFQPFAVSLLPTGPAPAPCRHPAKQAGSLGDAAAGTLPLSTLEPRWPLKRVSVALRDKIFGVHEFSLSTVSRTSQPSPLQELHVWLAGRFVGLDCLFFCLSLLACFCSCGGFVCSTVFFNIFVHLRCSLFMLMFWISMSCVFSPLLLKSIVFLIWVLCFC